MPKFLLSIMLILVSFKAAAHSHPGIDQLTHSLEHMLQSNTLWLPYLLGAGGALMAVVYLLSWRRTLKHTRRSGL